MFMRNYKGGALQKLPWLPLHARATRESQLKDAANATATA